MSKFERKLNSILEAPSGPIVGQMVATAKKNNLQQPSDSPMAPQRPGESGEAADHPVPAKKRHRQFVNLPDGDDRQIIQGS